MKNLKLIIVSLILFFAIPKADAQYHDTIIIKLDDYGLIKFMSSDILDRNDKFKNVDTLYVQFYSELVNSDYKFDKDDVEFVFYSGYETSSITINEKKNEKEIIYTDSTNFEYIHDYPYKIVFPDFFGETEKVEIFISKPHDLKAVFSTDLYILFQKTIKILEEADFKKRAAITGIFNSKGNILIEKKILKEGKLDNYLSLYPAFGVSLPDINIASSVSIFLEYSFMKKIKSHNRAFGLSYQMVMSPLKIGDNNSIEYNIYSPVFAYYRFSTKQFGMAWGLGADPFNSYLSPYFMMEIKRNNFGLRISNLGQIIRTHDVTISSFTLGLNYYF